MTVVNKRILVTVSIIMILAVAIFTSIKIVSVGAMDPEVQPAYKYYTSYEVQPGDTLTSIAEANKKDCPLSTGEYIDEVMKINNLTSDRITSGKNIIIVYYSHEYK